MNKLKILLAGSLVGMVVVGCGGTSSAQIGGTLTGLSGGTTVQLLNNGANPLTMSANGFFAFSTSIQSGSTYNVSVGTQPIGETCSVTNGTGTVSSNGAAVTNVAVSCVANIGSNNVVFGAVSGLPTGGSVQLANGADTLTLNVNGAFAFPTAVAVGGSYAVSIVSTSTGLNCTLGNATGTIPATGSITAIVVSCQ